ncbi:Fatty acid metabolism regulator protein [Nocardia cerradoensis]|uniref:Fatty acid metabolism regulator protein n=1 Tax=Nocardia cerradoensis TaxID=85688 RepID=A0A231GXB4_9NOCA|nr:TetR/AcrR family transcriptional regulator [Nocardia cerradoensis]OXR41205.1 Fatty acid metabolism regulator protein [Nocardia cerradoensis]
MKPSKAPSSDAGPDTRRRILDAAVEMAEITGLRKVSMDEIARRARVGRATLYLHFSGRDNLISAMIEDQLGQFFADVQDVLDQHDNSEDRLVHGFAHAFRLLLGNRAVRTVLAVNPEVLYPAIIGDSQPLLLGRLLIESAMGAEDLPAESRSLFAEHVARMFHTYVLIPTQLVDMAAPGVAEDFARQFLLPIRDHLLAAAAEAPAR